MTTLPEPTIDAPPLRARRRFRFSLRTILILTTIVALFFGLGFSRAERQKHAVDGILALGGSVTYDWQIPHEGVTVVSQLKPPGPKWLRDWLGPHWLDRVVALRLGTFGRTDNARLSKYLAHAVELPSLRNISISLQDIDGEEGRRLAQLKNLEELFGGSLTITPAGAKELARAPHLRKMVLDYVEVSPAALEALAALPSLDEFQLQCRPLTKKDWLTDDGLRALAHFKRLRSLELFHTLITDAGVEKLRDLDELESLTISSPQITGKSLAVAADLKSLKSLGTWQWRLTPDDLAILANTPRLTSLDLLTHLSNDSIPTIAKLTQLESLRLRGLDITDAALPQLHVLKNLRRLDLADTSVDKLGVAAQDLQNALPGCVIRLPKTEAEKKREAISSMHNGW